MIPRGLLLLAVPTCALAATAFDVASVKPGDPADRRMRLESFTGGQFAWRLESYQSSGGPGWMVTSRNDVTEQPGLKSDKGPVDVYVIDQAEKPSEN